MEREGQVRRSGDGAVSSKVWHRPRLAHGAGTGIINTLFMHHALRSSLTIVAIAALAGCQTHDRRIYSTHQDKKPEPLDAQHVEGSG